MVLPPKTPKTLNSLPFLLESPVVGLLWACCGQVCAPAHVPRWRDQPRRDGHGLRRKGQQQLAGQLLAVHCGKGVQVWPRLPERAVRQWEVCGPAQLLRPCEERIRIGRGLRWPLHALPQQQDVYRGPRLPECPVLEWEVCSYVH